ncbi:WW domain-binding protein 4 [Larimichthys crocea]|uniref:Uncharacterized protein n=1 Tax=Larimichthys crocea TaxID=215358 RepID=A0ACD3QY60_LARCR|nr:WW domain-binding protein 4 [Larimichthys crocea]
MADYWKSQPRKFCQYCKCWIADNKPSVEFHERGKNHKENVAAKISEIKKKSVDKAKQEERQSKQFAAMEEAAMKAYEEDLKRMEREAAGLPPLATTPPQPQVKPQVRVQVKPQGKHKGKKQQTKGKGGGGGRGGGGGGGGGRKKLQSADRVSESRWDKPEGFQGESSASAEPAPPGSSSGCPWMEAVSPDGYTYYYNSETGGGEESSNGAPASSQEAEVTEDADQQPKVPKISFRKRKAEEADSAEKEGEDEVSEDAPKERRRQRERSKLRQLNLRRRRKPKSRHKERRRLNGRKPPIRTACGRRSRKRRIHMPAWTLQLPQVEAGTAGAPADLPPEPKPKFRERVITSLGDEGGPASFRKNKAQNGKSRSLRQRDNDD